MITPQEILIVLHERLKARLKLEMRPLVERILEEECAKYAVEVSKYVSFETRSESTVITLRIANDRP